MLSFSKASVAIVSSLWGVVDENVILFHQLLQKYGCELHIVVTNLSRMCSEYCNYKTCPNIPIRDAVRMSMSFPGEQKINQTVWLNIINLKHAGLQVYVHTRVYTHMHRNMHTCMHFVHLHTLGQKPALVQLCWYWKSENNTSHEEVHNHASFIQTLKA